MAELRALSQDRLLRWYRDTVTPGGAQRRKLCIHVAGRSQAQELSSLPPAAAGTPPSPNRKLDAPASLCGLSMRTLIEDR